jgi:site-specific DNA-cytosine methylase
LWWVKAKRAQNDQDDETWAGGGVVPTLNQFDNGDTRATVIIFDTGSHGDGIRMSDGIVPTMNARMGTGGNNTPMVSYPATVRRLTPMECERLQGFPDGWTTHRIDEKKGLVEQADSSRYKQMGNAVAVPVVEWIINRLVEAHSDNTPST